MPKNRFDCKEILLLVRTNRFDRKKNRLLVPKIRFDCIFNAIHGSPGEDGKLAKILESLNVPFTSSNSKSAELTFNKKR